METDRMLDSRGSSTVPTIRAGNILEAVKPFEADDGHKGTFLVLRIAGLEQAMALRSVNRKYRSWQNWRATDESFREIDDLIPALKIRFGGEARVLRTALLDISVIETGVFVFKRILDGKPVSSDMWNYVTRLAGLRVPVMGAKEESGSPWERLANRIQNTLEQRELTFRQEADGTKSITARELKTSVGGNGHGQNESESESSYTPPEPSPEQRRVAREIVERILERERKKKVEKVEMEMVGEAVEPTPPVELVPSVEEGQTQSAIPSNLQTVRVGGGLMGTEDV